MKKIYKSGIIVGLCGQMVHVRLIKVMMVIDILICVLNSYEIHGGLQGQELVKSKPKTVNFVSKFRKVHPWCLLHRSEASPITS